MKLQKILAFVLSMAVPMFGNAITADAYVYGTNSINGVFDQYCHNYSTGNYDLNLNDSNYAYHSIVSYYGTDSVLKIPSSFTIALVSMSNPGEYDGGNYENHVSWNMPIHAISENAFKDNTVVKKIILPEFDDEGDGANICANVFYNSAVRSITVNGKCSLEENSLYNCRYLQQIVLNTNAELYNLEESKLGYCLDDNGNEYINDDLQIYYYDDSATESILVYANENGLKTPILLSVGEEPPAITTEPIETTTTPTETTTTSTQTTTAPTQTTTPVKTPPDDIITTTTTATTTVTTPPNNTIEYDENYDVNKDGKVNLIDLLLMKKKILGM